MAPNPTLRSPSHPPQVASLSASIRDACVHVYHCPKRGATATSAPPPCLRRLQRLLQTLKPKVKVLVRDRERNEDPQHVVVQTGSKQAEPALQRRLHDRPR